MHAAAATRPVQLVPVLTLGSRMLGTAQRWHCRHRSAEAPRVPLDNCPTRIVAWRREFRVLPTPFQRPPGPGARRILTKHDQPNRTAPREPEPWPNYKSVRACAKCSVAAAFNAYHAASFEII